MRHQRTGKKLGRDSAHRKALYSNLAGCADRARADQDDGHEGEGGQAARRADDHARPPRRPPRSPPGGRVPALEGRRAQAVRRGRSARSRTVPGGYTRIVKHRPARGRRRRDGLPRARRHAARLQGASVSEAARRPTVAAAPEVAEDAVERRSRATRPRRKPSRREAEPGAEAEAAVDTDAGGRAEPEAVVEAAARRVRGRCRRAPAAAKLEPAPTVRRSRRAWR